MKTAWTSLGILRAVAVINLIGLVIVAATLIHLWRSAGAAELTVQRINIVEPDGRVRMVIANSACQTPGVINGHPQAARARPAGIIFFNDEGDETGGLVFGGRQGHANASLTFDQYHQDQTVGLTYGETSGNRHGGLYVWDRADMPLDELVARFKAVQALPPEERDAALSKLPQDNGARRVFAGKNDDRSAEVTLFDVHGRPRLSMKVDAAGEPSHVFLDENGHVVSRLPANGTR